LEDLVAEGLAKAGAGTVMARTTAQALVAAEAEGMASHGLFRAGQYAGHLKSAAAGMVGLAFGNSPAAMPAWGGRRPIFGTNPVAAVFPRRDAPPLVIDLSLSEVARGKLMVAAREGKPIPLGWAVDKDGQPTTDAKAALDGMMLPAGGVKGAMLALVVELLCCALTGAAFGFEADSFLAEDGNRARIGQAFMVIDPGALAGDETFHRRLELLVNTMLLDESVRLPGSRRQGASIAARRSGVEVAPAMLAQLQALAAA
jgi:(2R)-3-sulfolactate dehydrogenase (NADP+)